MKIKDMTKEDLELLSYTDLTYKLLNENKSPMTTPTIFKKICSLLDYNEQDYVDKIGDYYTSLTLDNRFFLLEDARWDLSSHHIIKIEIDDDEETDEAFEEKEEEEEEEEEDIDAVVEDEDLEDVEDELDNLTIVDSSEVGELE